MASKYTLTKNKLRKLNPCSLEKHLTRFGDAKSLTVGEALEKGFSISEVLWVAGELGFHKECCKFAILVAKPFFEKNVLWNKWAEDWLSGKDRTESAAQSAAQSAAASAAWSAESAAQSAAWSAAASAARSAAWSAESAAWSAAQSAAASAERERQQKILVQVFSC